MGYVSTQISQKHKCKRFWRGGGGDRGVVAWCPSIFLTSPNPIPLGANWIQSSTLDKHIPLPMWVCVCVWISHTHPAGLDCFYSQVLVCRSHSKRENEAEIKTKKSQQAQQTKGDRGSERVLTLPVQWESILCFSLHPLSASLPTPCLAPPPLQFSPLGSSLLIVWAFWCLSGPSLYVSIKHSIYLIIALTTAY